MMEILMGVGIFFVGLVGFAVLFSRFYRKPGPEERASIWECRNCGQHHLGVLDRCARIAILSNVRLWDEDLHGPSERQDSANCPPIGDLFHAP